jgi:hypothetical protein
LHSEITKNLTSFAKRKQSMSSQNIATFKT